MWYDIRQCAPISLQPYTTTEKSPSKSPAGMAKGLVWTDQAKADIRAIAANPPCRFRDQGDTIQIMRVLDRTNSNALSAGFVALPNLSQPGSQA